MIEHAYFVKNISRLSSLPDNTSRIYLGSDFCIKAYPKNFRTLVEEVKSRYHVSLLMPPILESELKLMERYLTLFTELAEKDDEIIFNDLGGLFFFRKNYKKNIKTGLGRYYSYQKRGVQKLYDAVKKEDLRDVPLMDELTIDFLRSIGVVRIEIDATPYGINMDKLPDMAVSIYLDHILTSYTINCPYTFNGKYWGRTCSRQCLSSSVIFSSEENLSDFYETGRAYYQEGLKTIPPGIDRLVRFRWNQD